MKFLNDFLNPKKWRIQSDSIASNGDKRNPYASTEIQNSTGRLYVFFFKEGFHIFVSSYNKTKLDDFKDEIQTLEMNGINLIKLYKCLKDIPCLKRINLKTID